jgi:hypothetical protein
MSADQSIVNHQQCLNVYKQRGLWNTISLVNIQHDKIIVLPRQYDFSQKYGRNPLSEKIF